MRLARVWREFLSGLRESRGRWLVITSPDQGGLYEFFKQAFAGASRIEVRVDRRSGAQRQRPGRAPDERRDGDRRSRPHVDAELRASGFAFVDLPQSPDDPGSGDANGRGPKARAGR